MGRQDHQETVQILRGLLFLRLALLAPFLVVILFATSCKPGLATELILLLLAMAGIPPLFYFLRRQWLTHPFAPLVIVLFDFLAASLLSLVSLQNQGLPIFFPLYFFLVALEAACWWGWPGALISGAAGGVVLSWLYMGSPSLQANQGLAMVALVMAWPVVLGYFVQWALRQWRERMRMANWLARQEKVVRQVQERLDGWQAACTALQGVTSPQALLRTALREVMTSTTSMLGLITLRDPQSGSLRAECWEGFALADPDRATLRPGEKLPAPEGGGSVEVRHILEAPLCAATPGATDSAPPDLGRVVVARQNDLPYQGNEEQWLHIIASYTATLLENRFLRGQLGRIRQEADSIVLAGWTLASLPDPAAAIEMACRNILSTLALQQVIIFLYGEGKEPGCRVIIYPAQEPARTATVPLQGRGLRLLRRFLDSGTSVIVNRRGEWPEIFELMGWDGDVQAIACFPLYVLEHRWGALCLLAKVPDAFPAQTQQNLTIFSGEVAMALENFYLRRSVAEAKA